ncbi:MAG: efflux RND transporter permease subunit, partial [Thermoanaerobaculia bacterium]|nr:efflux RND transporter permease subunit [Thermoanaerobaculia bacterium]
MEPARRLSLLEALFQRPRSVLLAALAVTFAGVWAAARLPIEWVPKVELPSITLS